MAERCCDLQTVNSSVSSSGRKWASPCPRSPQLASRVVMGFGSPPAAGTPRISAGPPVVMSNAIVPLLLQDAPVISRVGHNWIGAPSSRRIFQSASRAQKPIQTPSGEKKGASAPSVPSSGTAASSSSLRR